MWSEKTHHKYSHQPHAPSGSSKEKFPNKRQPKFIPDNYSSVDEVTAALHEAGLESSNLILGIDFTKSNEWSGRHSFGRKSLDAINETPNPYEQAISIIGRTLSPFDDDNLIPCFGFGDALTHDHSVFSFYQDNRPCRGFEEVLVRYQQIVPHLNLSGRYKLRHPRSASWPGKGEQEAAAAGNAGGRTVCVTGSGGYLVSSPGMKRQSTYHCSQIKKKKLILSRGYAVHGTVRDLSDKKTAHLKRLENASECLKLFRADLLDDDAMAAAVAGCQGVFHVATPVPSGNPLLIQRY